MLDSLLIATVLVAALPATAAPAGPSILHLSADRTMALVLVDGAPIDGSDCPSPKACDVVELAPGVHEIEIRTGMFGTKGAIRGRIEVAANAEVWAKATKDRIEVYNTQPRALPADVAMAAVPVTSQSTTTTVTQRVGNPGGLSAGVSFVDPATGEPVSIHAGFSIVGGPSATVTESVTTTTTVSAPPPVAVSGPAGMIELTSQDGESFTVYLDGKKVGTFNGLEGQSIKVKKVAPGEHTLTIKDFMEEDVWTTGRLYMDPGFTLKMGVDEGAGVEAFNNAGAWQPTR